MNAKKFLKQSSIPYTLLIPIFVSLLVYSSYRIYVRAEEQNIFKETTYSPVGTSSIVPVHATVQPPTEIYIPKINKRLPIQSAVVKGNNWELFEKSVSWLSTSAVPGKGNVILYAHDWVSLWGDLYKVQPGDMVEIDVNGKQFTYKVTESREVSKNDIDAVLSDDNRLTMYTCEGTFDQKRRVVYALPL